jgi:hypothetical protein
MDQILSKETEAHALLGSIDDSITRNLVQIVVAELRRRSVPPKAANNQWRENLPEAPIDMVFLVHVLTAVMKDHRLLADLLAGKTLEQAAGWDV